jgi:hypothetical protein
MKHAGSDAWVGALSFPRFGDRSTAWQAQATVKSGGLSVNVAFDVVLVRKRRAVSIYLFGGLGPPNTAQEIALVRKAVRRA